jgi:hypothetical protein
VGAQYFAAGPNPEAGKNRPLAGICLGQVASLRLFRNPGAPRMERSEMAQHRIIGTRRESCDTPRVHAHVVIVGTEKSSGYSKLWTITQVYNAMDQGDTFYTCGEKSQKIVAVQKYSCPLCAEKTLRSAPEAATDDNLDSLPTCQ